MPDVKFTVDGKQLTAPAGTFLIEACKMNGIEVPAFCYYPGISLKAACRMCVVRIEKMPKLPRSRRHARLLCNSSSAITPLIALSAMLAASANCRT
jgi:predicted molibdopterin-dependent oxidoreductase YjgC